MLRWEYLPGSILFVVWTQGRQAGVGQEGSTNFLGDVHDLFSLPADNSFLIKVSYWLNR